MIISIPSSIDRHQAVTRHAARGNAKAKAELAQLERCVAAIKAAGSGAKVHHARAKTRGGRMTVATALERLGVPHRLVRTLDWSSRGDVVEAAPAPAQASEKPKRAKKAAAEATA